MSTRSPATVEIFVNIDVDDLERAIAFYGSALGLNLHRRLFGGSVAEMRAGSTTIHLLQRDAASPAAPGVPSPRDYARHWTPVHLDFAVDDIVETVQRAVAAGARLESEIESFPWGRMARMSDPFGHGFCLLELGDRGYDDAT